MKYMAGSKKNAEIFSALKIVSQKHNNFISAINILEKSVVENVIFTNGTLQNIMCYEVFIKIKVDELKYTAFLLYSNVDILVQEIKRIMPYTIWHKINIEVI